MYDIIVGLDISLSDTGIVVLRCSPTPGVLDSLSTKECAALYDPLRQVCITNRVTSFVMGFANVKVAAVIEDHAFGKFTGKARTRAELIGMIKYQMLVTLGFDVYLVSPTALKRFMGVADKEQRKDKLSMFKACSNRFRFVSSNDNIVDAYCLTRYLLANLEGQRLTLVKNAKMPHMVLPVQVPAPKKPLKIRDKPALTKGMPGTSVSNIRLGR